MFTNRLLCLGASAGALSLRGSGCRNLALPGVYEQASTLFPASYPTSLLQNLTHTSFSAVCAYNPSIDGIHLRRRSFVESEVQHQVFGQGSRAVLPALGQLLHLFAELGERFDRELRIVSLQDIDVAVGIDEFEDRLALGIDHPLRLFRHEDLGYWGVTEVFGPMWLARGLRLYSGYPTLK